MQMHHAIDTSSFMNSGANILHPVDPSMMSDFAGMAGDAMPMFNKPEQDQDPRSKSMLVNAIFSWNSDLKIAVLAMGVFILVSVLPIESYVYTYVALEKIPYSNIIIKAVLAGIILVILLHMNR